MEMKYKEVDRILYPDLAIRGTIQEPLTKYGMMRKEYLEKNYQGRFNTMILKGTLYPHCKEMEQEVKMQMEMRISQMKKQTDQNLLQTRILEIESQLIKEMILVR
ncbi:MAG: TnpV protein [Clostridiales bacterium]|nr:TnpV protein [Clostridiales bacterium]